MDYGRNFLGVTSQPTELAELLETRDRMIDELQIGVGALFALRAAWHQGMSVESSMRIGRTAGLKGLDAVVELSAAKWPPPIL